MEVADNSLTSLPPSAGAAPIAAFAALYHQWQRHECRRPRTTEQILTLLSGEIEARVRGTKSLYYSIEQDDLRQGVCLAVAAAIARFEPTRGKSFHTYLQSVVRGAAQAIATDQVEQQVRHQTLPLSSAAVIPAADQVAPAERRIVLEGYLNRLTVAQSDVLRGRYFEGLTWPEIGAQFGFSESNARRIASEALAVLAAMMSPELAADLLSDR